MANEGECRTCGGSIGQPQAVNLECLDCARKRTLRALKAYVVPAESLPEEGYRDVIFVSTRGLARAVTANRLSIPFLDVTSDDCERAPELDSYSPGPVPVRALIEEHDWWFDCEKCNRRVNVDSVGEYTKRGVLCDECAMPEPTDA